jgi:ribonucleoside-diphosphate reductase alpha chain
MEFRDWLPDATDLQETIWNNKYRFNNETFEEWLDRVSGFSLGWLVGEKMKKLILERKFLPGGRILASLGIKDENVKVTLSNCYTISPPKDNLESIFETAKRMARTYSYGGGIGADLGSLAPKGAKVRNAAKSSSGAVSFMDLYDLVTGLIAQNGRRK